MINVKKSIFIVVFIIISHTGFSQSNELPAFLIEANAGYAIGFTLDNTVPINLKLTYLLLGKYGLMLEAGCLLTSDQIYFNGFIGPVVFFYINEKWRVPVSIGLAVIDGNTFYYGIGSTASIHYIFNKHFFMGINLGVTYAFNNVYEELTGYKTITTTYNEGTFTQTVPVYEKKNHLGNYIYLKPLLLIGLQF